MQIAIIGLGRMGGNIARRLMEHGHEVVAFDRDAQAVQKLESEHAKAAHSLGDVAKLLKPPRAAWVMLPAGKPTDDTVAQLGELFEKGDTIIDGGNTFYRDDIRRSQALAPKGVHYVDVGTSGGVWGAERGYCMMIGGEKEVVDRLDPIFSALAPGLGDITRTPKREGRDPRPEQGYLYAGPVGAGHFVKMIHNGIEYGLMQAYAEGFSILRGKAEDASDAERYKLNLPDIAEVWRRGSVISSWLLDLAAIALAANPELNEFSGFVDDSGEGRWTINAAIEEAVPAPVLSAALYARFRSRLDHDFGDKLLSALRNQFGGHIEGQLEKIRIVKPERASPCAMVIFGANGDLTKRLIIPALYNLTRSGLLPQPFALIGVDHNDIGADVWRKQLHDFLEETVKQGGGEFEATAIDEDTWNTLGAAMSYVAGDFNDAGTFDKLKKHLEERDGKEHLQGCALFYLAVPDRFFGPLVESISKAGLTDETKGWRRVVIEKPFGHDLESAKALNAQVLKCLKENQVFRIDHFLGKETVQNIMALRFANGLFEPIWNRDRIDHVQITVSETIGIEDRGKFYEATGALRDMIPNHLFQLVAMTAMEPPASFDADAVRSKKAELFQAVHTLTPDDAVRGQYGAGSVDGKEVRGYREEPNVAPDSIVETYAAVRLSIDNWRWAGVPFYLRTGKKMPKRMSEIAIRFKDAPLMLFRDTPTDELHDNWLILQIQPDEGIRLRFNAKRPGPEMLLDSVAMDFHYSDWFKQSPAVGYETLLYDCIQGDATLFQRADQVEASWRVVDPLLKAWSAPPADAFPNYAAGSAGPEAADKLLARDGRKWRAIR